MPLIVNMGLFRTNSVNYQSAGVSINLTAELDQSLLADPASFSSYGFMLFRSSSRRFHTKSCTRQRPPPRLPTALGPPRRAGHHSRMQHRINRSGVCLGVAFLLTLTLAVTAAVALPQ